MHGSACQLLAQQLFVAGTQLPGKIGSSFMVLKAGDRIERNWLHWMQFSALNAIT
jgi:hypothetical protein